MRTKTANYKDMKKKRLIFNIWGDILVIVGTIIAYRYEDMILIIGNVIALLGCALTVNGIRIKTSKKYKELAQEEDTESIKDITNEFGLSMVIIVVLFAVGLIANALILFHYFVHSWVEALLFLVALDLVVAIRDYFRSDKEVED
ncbi:hypothetical protein [Lactobacillus crispatus]|uniref:Uncharacterized protein n=1 Tax=Lactobacillus crispatus TaxID=47770 RepID=A0A7H9E7B6_9LACO|nr:hypothetical protein [Lactobacillus crispatus]QLL73533.1 hypothetical protein GTO85_03695 [Lactobacillus crispatus]